MTLVAGTIVQSAQGYAQAIRAGGHELTADEPVRAGGTDTGPTPYGLLLAGLGACTAITLRMYAERHGWELGQIRVSLRLFKEGEADRIERDIRCSAPLTEEQLVRLREIAERTPVTKTIKAGATIATQLS